MLCDFVVAALLALALASCGRLDFPPQIDAQSGHDEDGDGIPDVDDPCPHVAGDRADRDGDGVGDACDPNPDLPIDHWVSFSTMQPGDEPFDDITGFDQLPDALHTTGDIFPRVPHMFGTTRIDLGFEIHGVVGTGQRQIAAGIDGGANVYYFAELNEGSGVRDVSVVSFDSTNGYAMLDPVGFPSMHAGTGYFRLDAVVTSPPAFHFETGWIGELYRSDAATPAYVGGDTIRFSLHGLDVDLRYLALIATE